ncbi:MAG TPA: AMP-binding protein [Kiritimatiellia bacterium]|jgi:long-chain acyl-CoA synthetase|nr:AMP-binding protein [Kiritimatiellia bacterium]
MTIRTLLDAAVKQTPGAPAQRFFKDGKWVARRYDVLQERVARTAAILQDLRIEPGRDHVALMLDNCPEWQEIYLALACAGVTAVPLDPKLREQEVVHILADSESVAVFAGIKTRGVLLQAAAELPNLRACVWVGGHDEDGTTSDKLEERSYDALMATMPPSSIQAAQTWLQQHIPTPETIASIIYTSGTTGKPKGAMLTHGNFTSNVAGTLERVSFYPTDNFLNVLPLFHSFSFTANFMLPLGVKGCCSFVRSIRTIAEDMTVLQPTVLLAVPLMAEKLYARIAERLRKNLVARGLLGIGLKRVVSKKVIESFGGRLRLLGIGGAPTALSVLQGFIDIGIPVLEGYGLTECSPGVAYPWLDAFVPGTVGPVLDNMQFKLADVDATGAGELCVRGPNVMQGYYKNLEATTEVFDDEGYFCTGDLVRIDDRGNVTICGRKKAMIVNREGKNIYPEEIEQIIERCPLVRDVVVLGYRIGDESGERIGAILVPDTDAVTAHNKGEPLSEPDTEALLRETVLEHCRSLLADYKTPRKLIVYHTPLERTSTLKVRRIVYAGSLDESAAPDLVLALSHST